MLLVCSVHRETGLATAAELCWLLGRLRPDVLFLEHSATNFSAFLDGSCGSLESAAVMHYRSLHAVELIPVDLHLHAAELKEKFDELFDRIGEVSHRYGYLQLANLQHTANGGFAYLNSATNAVLQSEIQSGGSCQAGSVQKGALLVGSAHRQPLFEKSKQSRSDGPSLVTWDFEWELEEATIDGDVASGGNTTDRGALG